MREKQKNLRKIAKTIIWTIVTLEGDNRFLAKTTIVGQEALTLLDSGVGASYLGTN